MFVFAAITLKSSVLICLLRFCTLLADLLGLVDLAALDADHAAMVADTNMPFSLPHPLADLLQAK